jgi:hypothetical protein
MYQEQAAQKIRVSRQTFGRIIASAHKKVAEALVKGKSIVIEGGEVSSLNLSASIGASDLCTCPKRKMKHSDSCQEMTCPKCGKEMMNNKESEFQNNQ